MPADHAVPLVVSFIHRSARRERHTLATLASVFAARPDLRERLADPTRVAALARDLTAGLQSMPMRVDTVRRDPTDVVTAMRAAGFVHPFGRPLGPGTVGRLDDVVAATRAALEANPYRQGRDVDHEQLVRLVRCAYFDVEPWPFRALLASSRPDD
jgi:hypothetical protein